MRSHSRLTHIQSKRFNERRKTRTWFVVGLSAVCVFTWAFSLSRLSELPALAVTSVTVTGADQDIVPTIRSTALKLLDGRYLGLFSRDNAFIYPRSSILAAVAAASPRIQSVSVNGNAGLNTLSITVTEKPPAAIVCSGLPDFSSNDDTGTCYFADKTGLLLGTAPSFSGNVYHRYYMPSMSGGIATSSHEFQTLQSFYDGAQGAGINVTAILAKDGGEYEMYVQNPGNSAATSSDSNVAVIYFNDVAPLSDQLVNLISFWKNRTAAAATNHSSVSFEYIDLRYGSNIYYR